MSTVPRNPLLRMNWAIPPRNRPGVSLLSKFQSLTIGVSQAWPNTNWKLTGGVVLLTFGPFVRIHSLVDGLNTPMVSMPSPFQSPATGMSPACPKVRVINDALDLEFCLNKNCPVEGRKTPG